MNARTCSGVGTGGISPLEQSARRYSLLYVNAWRDIPRHITVVFLHYIDEYAIHPFSSRSPLTRFRMGDLLYRACFWSWSILIIHSAKQRLIHTLFNEFPYNLWVGEYIGSWGRKGIKSFSKRTPFTLECMSFIFIEVVPKTAPDTFERSFRTISGWITTIDALIS